MPDQGAIRELFSGTLRTFRTIVDFMNTNERIDSMFTRYVVGFAIRSNSTVVLIQKRRPDWQAGKYNGVGGHVEEGETLRGAMFREFEEETGARVHNWEHFVTLTDSTNWSVAFFGTMTNIPVKTTTDEMISEHLVSQLPKNVVPNLYWLIPMYFHRNTSVDWPYHVIEKWKED